MGTKIPEALQAYRAGVYVNFLDSDDVENVLGVVLGFHSGEGPVRIVAVGLADAARVNNRNIQPA